MNSGGSEQTAHDAMLRKIGRSWIPNKRVPRFREDTDTPHDRVGRAYSAALAARACSASSKASMRRAVACGDFVYRASML